jgi:deaminated glutathione amidase
LVLSFDESSTASGGLDGSLKERVLGGAVSESSATMTVAAVQMSSGSDVAANLASAEALIDEATGRGATYVQLPEYFNFLGPAARYGEVAEAIPGPTTRHFGEIARARGVTIHLGSMLERSPGHAKPFNTSVILDARGEVAAAYRKVHLFDVDVPDEINFRESDAIAAGDELVVVPLEGLQLGLSVCFDLRFAELYRTLAQGGATVLAIPSAFNARTGAVHWEVLVRARAIENHAYVVAAAQVGTTTEGIATYGHALIVGPWGEVLAQSLAPGPDVLVATIDGEEVTRRRHQIAVLELRRPEVYRHDVS